MLEPESSWTPSPPEGVVLAAIAGRRSAARVDTEAPVPQVVLERALAMAALAPNHRLTEPWRFTVVRGDARRRVGEALAAEGVESGRVRAERAPLEASKWLRAPVVVVVSHDPAGTDVVELEDRLALGACVENLLLALDAQGYAAMWRTGASAGSPAVKAALGLAPAAEIVALVYAGRPLADAPLPPRRRQGAEVHTRWLDA
jgi:nitroreductase